MEFQRVSLLLGEFSRFDEYLKRSCVDIARKDQMNVKDASKTRQIFNADEIFHALTFQRNVPLIFTFIRIFKNYSEIEDTFDESEDQSNLTTEFYYFIAQSYRFENSAIRAHLNGISSVVYLNTAKHYPHPLKWRQNDWH